MLDVVHPRSRRSTPASDPETPACRGPAIEPALFGSGGRTAARSGGGGWRRSLSFRGLSLSGERSNERARSLSFRLLSERGWPRISSAAPELDKVAIQNRKTLASLFAFSRLYGKTHPEPLQPDVKNYSCPGLLALPWYQQPRSGAMGVRQSTSHKRTDDAAADDDGQRPAPARAGSPSESSIPLRLQSMDPALMQRVNTMDLPSGLELGRVNTLELPELDQAARLELEGSLGLQDLTQAVAKEEDVVDEADVERAAALIMRVCGLKLDATHSQHFYSQDDESHVMAGLRATARPAGRPAIAVSPPLWPSALPSTLRPCV